MKHSKSLCWALYSVFFLASSAFAAETRTKVTTEVVNTPRSIQRTITTVETHPWGLGIATAQQVTDTASALTAWFALDEIQSFQLYFGMDSTTPLNFGAGALYKRTCIGNSLSGMHFGGGVGLGDRSDPAKFFFRVTGVIGIHFDLPGVKDLYVQADAGPSLLLSSGSNNFSLKAFSPLLGLSLVYLL